MHFSICFCIELIFFFACESVMGYRVSYLQMLGKGFSTQKNVDLKYSGKLRPGVVEPRFLPVPDNIPRPDYAVDGIPKAKRRALPWIIEPQTPEDIARMRIAGRIAREVLDEAIRFVKPGVMTKEIDKIVHDATVARNSFPSTLNYNGFPKSCCTSINEVICHGIPDTTVLAEGDIINIDVTVFYDGVHGDCSETVFVGQVSDKVKDLVVTTYNAWQTAIAYCKPGAKYNEIGGIIEDIVAARGYTTVKEFCGHGIGRIFHTTPNVLHYRNNVKSGVMQPGHTFTIEPMICMGKAEVLQWDDNWTFTTKDGLPSAQFEHTLLITDTGVEALTAKLPDSPKYSWE